MEVNPVKKAAMTDLIDIALDMAAQLDTPADCRVTPPEAAKLLRELAEEVERLRSELAEARELLREHVIAAYIAGAQAVHDNWHPDRAPDFTEAAHDYCCAIDAELAKDAT